MHNLLGLGTTIVGELVGYVLVASTGALENGFGPRWPEHVYLYTHGATRNAGSGSHMWPQWG